MFLKVLCALFFLGLAANAGADAPQERWVIYYGSSIPAQAFQNYDTIVFDSDSHPPLADLQASHKTLLGYLSLGEAEDFRSYYHTIEKKKLLLARNPQWKGHRVVDIRKPEWATYVNDVLIPPLLAQGFDGIMLDTLDSPLDLENDKPKKYPGMKQAAIRLIHSIRTRYPHIQIMVNRGFDVLSAIAPDINMVMAESIYSDWQPGKKKPVIVPKKDNDAYVTLLKNAQKQSPQLKLYSMDYWKPSDKEGMKRIYAAERQAGFIPYVSTLSLQSVTPEP